ncbi:MAG: sulfite oxidase-like oxidoreductase [Gaiellales bacterium]|nr:sulfite oxidase-like oxidoreductase [Gaiellales bacterium]
MAPLFGKRPDLPSRLAARVPPGQHVVERLPVLQTGSVRHLDRSSWVLRVTGLVDPPLRFSLEDILALPATSQVSDIHCVTTWSMLDTHWMGVQIADLLAGTRILPTARHVLVHGDRAWTTNLPLEELLRDDVLAAYEYEGSPLSDEHGGPVRLVVPRLYFWKSAKWMTEIEFMAERRLGYWESVGYHELGDPWKEQRYS